MMGDIPQEWILRYVDGLLRVAKTLEPHSDMHASIIARANAVMDMVNAFEESSSKKDE